MPTSRRRGRLTVALLTVVTALSCAPTKPKYELKLPELHATLKNGMRVIVLPDPSTELVEIDVRYEVGSNEDPPGKAGLAHLVEHLMFQQRPAGPDKPPLWDLFRSKSVFVNAYTTWDTTHYMVMAKKEELEGFIALEATRLHTGCQTITKEEFEREREVVRNEIRQRLGTPDGQVLYKLLEAIYPEGHPYRRMIGGDDEQLASITLEDVCKFMNDYYVPERATLVIAGATTEDEVARHVAKWMAELPARKGAPRAKVPPLASKRRKVVLEADVEETTVYAAWPLPARFSADDYAARFMIGRVAGGAAFFGEEYEFATDVGAGVLGGGLAPAFYVAVSVVDDGKVDDAEEAIFKAARSAHRGFKFADDESLDEVRSQLIANIVYGFESLQARTNLFGDYAQFDKERKFFGGELARVRALDGAKIGSYIESALDPDKAVVVVVKAKEGASGKARRAKKTFSAASHDKDSERDGAQIDPAEAKRPLPAPTTAGALANARRFRLGNGMQVVLLPSASELPVVTAALLFHVGTAHEPVAKAGLASIAADLLQPPLFDAGSGGGLESSNVLGRVGAQFFSDTDENRTIFVARGLEIYLEVVLRGLERMIKAGDYSQEAIERTQRRFRLLLKRPSVRRSLAFRRELRAAVFGPDHPYTVTGEVTVETFGRLGRDAAYDWKTSHYRAANATLVVAGKFDEARAEKIIKDHFGEWSGGKRDQPVTAPSRRPKGPAYVGVDAEDVVTVDVRIAFPTTKGIDGLYAARLVLAQMLSQRMTAVREKLGASYGVQASYAANMGPGMYVVGGALDAARAGEALRAMREAIGSLRAGTDFEVDFVKARRAVMKNLLVDSGDSLSTALELAEIAAYGLPPDHYDTLVKRVAALSPAMLKAIVAQELATDAESIVLLGERPAVTKAFKDAGIEPEAVRFVEK